MRRSSVALTALALAALALPAAALAQEAPAPDPAAAPAPDPVATTPEPAPTTPEPPPLPPTDVAGPTPATSWAGRLLVTSVARRNPGPQGKAFKVVEPIAPLGAGPVWLEVRGVRVVHNVRWVKMLLPMRPNGTEGWMRAQDFEFKELHRRVEIAVGARRLTVFQGSRRVATFPIAVGAAGTPTPTGTFAIAEVIPTGDPKAFLGTYVLPLTAFSRVLNEFAGGNGRVAIHGTSMPDLIGQAVSHGCIRMRNHDVGRVVKLVSAGAIVKIHN